MAVMAANPDPGRIPDALWYLWEQLHLLEPKSKLGGIYAFKPGYHSTRKDNQKNWPGNYSITDKEDQGGPSDKAAAIDWTFPDAQAGSYATIIKYSDRLRRSGLDPDDPRMDGWREFYGQCDADTAVEGYDFRYGRTATSDPSHLWHVHLSCDRDKVTSKANMDALLSVLRGDDMADLRIAEFGDTGEGVKRIQYQLRDLGYLPKTAIPDGVYGAGLATAVKKFRTDHGVEVVGDGKKVTGWMSTVIDADLRAKDAKPGPAGPAGETGPAGPPGQDAVAVGTVLQLGASTVTVTAVTPPA